MSIEVVAIAVTGLIGMVGYLVQARSAQKASEAQASLGREVAEREKVEAKAGKQLEHVQLQMAEWVRPMNMEIHFVWFGWLAIARECKLLGYLGLYSIEYAPQPATPYIDVYVNTNPTMFAALGRAPYAQLPPEALALLAAEPALRSRYCELAGFHSAPAPTAAAERSLCHENAPLREHRAGAAGLFAPGDRARLGVPARVLIRL